MNSFVGQKVFDPFLLILCRYGLAVHFRLYPVIFGPAFVLFLWNKKVQLEERPISAIVKQLLFSDGVKFFIVSASTCISITAFFYSLCVCYSLMLLVMRVKRVPATATAFPSV